VLRRKSWGWRFTWIGKWESCTCHKIKNDKVIECFGMLNSKLVSTPLVHFRLSAALSPQSKEEEQFMSCVPYSATVGSIMYAMVCACLDVS
jgi:hypothetical protein